MKTPFIFAFALCSQAFCDSFDGNPVPYLTDSFESLIPYQEKGERGDAEKKQQQAQKIASHLREINKTRNPGKVKSIKLNEKPFKYNVESAGTDDKKYICGRITITDAETGDEVGVYDYKSLIEGCVRNRVPFNVIVKKRGGFKEEMWILTPLDAEYTGRAVFLLTIKDRNFNDLIETKQYSSFHGSSNKTPVESIKKIREGGHAWLPKSMPPDDDPSFKKYKDGNF